jgi:hypothetical protein
MHPVYDCAVLGEGSTYAVLGLVESRWWCAILGGNQTISSNLPIPWMVVLTLWAIHKEGVPPGFIGLLMLLERTRSCPAALPWMTFSTTCLGCAHHHQLWCRRKLTLSNCGRLLWFLQMGFCCVLAIRLIDDCVMALKLFSFHHLVVNTKKTVQA